MVSSRAEVIFASPQMARNDWSRRRCQNGLLVLTDQHIGLNNGSRSKPLLPHVG